MLFNQLRYGEMKGGDLMEKISWEDIRFDRTTMSEDQAEAYDVFIDCLAKLYFEKKAILSELFMEKQARNITSDSKGDI